VQNLWNKQQIELYHKANEKTTNLRGDPNGHWKCQSLPNLFLNIWIHAKGQHQPPTYSEAKGTHLTNLHQGHGFTLGGFHEY
jgi:hypothetical protein